MKSTSLFYTLGLLTAIIGPAAAQTWTSCNPMNNTNCPSDTALGQSHDFYFTNSTASSSVWNQTAGTLNYGINGAELTVAQQGDAPTIQSEFYIFFGQVEVIMQAATGTGIVSSIVLESDDLDEVDWEIMGGNTTTVETNYFGKGNTTSYDRAKYYPVQAPQQILHNYTVLWTKDQLQWIIDSNVVRTLAYADAVNGTQYPQTPMSVRLGIWAGGDSKNPNGTIEWAGGVTDYGNGPYTMYVKSVHVQDFSTGSEYKYGDKTGSWESIQIVNGTSKLDLSNPKPSLTASQRWATLSHTAKIAIIASIAGVLGFGIAVLSFCCIKQRRAGRRVRAIEDAEFEKGTAELLQYRAEMGSGNNSMKSGRSGGYQGGHYGKV